ncbi:MAG: ATP-binding protein [Pseudomonadota bacterium]
MKLRLLQEIEQQNPWLVRKSSIENVHANSTIDHPALTIPHYRNRIQFDTLMLPEWDRLWTILIGPRRSGKTTLGKFLCHQLLKKGRFNELLYLNCDLEEVRTWLKSPLFIQEAMRQFTLTNPIVFVDEVQRLDSPGLMLKTLADLNLPIKMLASGSSQIELKSKIQEHLTGRHFSSLVLPLSFREWGAAAHLEQLLVYGAYPQIVDSSMQELLLGQLYQDYVTKDIIEILKLGQPDIFLKLLGLVAHSSGQLVNYSQLAADCQVSVSTVKHYLAVAQQTYVIANVTPFVGNKRTELTSNPIFYFLDNGFRNYALRNFSDPTYRADLGLLVEGLVFQELYKFITQTFLNYSIHYWRTKSGAKVDFVVYRNDQSILPVEVKYSNLIAPRISRGYRSFLQAYQPKNALMVTKNLIAVERIENVDVHFIPLAQLDKIFPFISKL